MPARHFLDTNIFVCSFDSASPKKSDRAQSLIRDAIRRRDGIVSDQVVQEFINVALRKFAKPMTPPEADRYLGTVFHPLLAVHSSAGLYAEALLLCGRHQLSWYDSLIVAAAIQGGCTALYSEDLQDGFETGGVRVVNPFR